MSTRAVPHTRSRRPHCAPLESSVVRTSCPKFRRFSRTCAAPPRPPPSVGSTIRTAARAGAAAGTGEPGRHDECWRLLPVGNTGAGASVRARGDRPAVRSERAARRAGARAASRRLRRNQRAESLASFAPVVPVVRTRDTPSSRPRKQQSEHHIGTLFAPTRGRAFGPAHLFAVEARCRRRRRPVRPIGGGGNAGFAQTRRPRRR